MDIGLGSARLNKYLCGLRSRKTEKLEGSLLNPNRQEILAEHVHIFMHTHTQFPRRKHGDKQQPIWICQEEVVSKSFFSCSARGAELVLREISCILTLVRILALFHMGNFLRKIKEHMFRRCYYTSDEKPVERLILRKL